MASDPALDGKGLENHLSTVWESESGLSRRLFAEYFGSWAARSDLHVLLGASVNALQDAALALVGLAAEYALPAIDSRVGLGVAHQSWVDLGSSENRVVAYVTFQPISALSASLGLGYRAPQYGGLDWRHALSWPAGSAEVGVLYRLQLEFLRYGIVAASAVVCNYDRMRLYAADNVHFMLEPVLHVLTHLTVEFKVAIGVQGVSGGVLSWSQHTLGVGLRYDL